MRYIQELEHKVQVLQTEATTLSAQLTMLQVCFSRATELVGITICIMILMFKLSCSACLQRDSSGLATQNNELKIRLQAMEQQAQLRDGKLLAVVCIMSVLSFLVTIKNHPFPFKS